MKRSLLSALLLTLALGAPLAVSAQDLGEDSMLAEINMTRQAAQLPPLTRAPALDAIARSHSAEMAQRGALAHVSDTTGSPEDRVRAAGLASPTVAENVAMHRDAAQAQQALLASDPHRGNMLSASATHVGLGVVPGAQGVYVTQVFAALPDAAAPPAVEAPAYGIIPPFVENAVEAVTDPLGAAVNPAPTAAPAPVIPTVDPFGVADGAPEAPAPEAPLAEAAVADAAPEAPAPEAPADQAPEAAPQTLDVSPEAATGLRQLIDLGLSILRGPPPAA